MRRRGVEIKLIERGEGWCLQDELSATPMAIPVGVVKESWNVSSTSQSSLCCSSTHSRSNHLQNRTMKIASKLLLKSESITTDDNATPSKN